MPASRKLIPKERLHKLYFENNLSMDQIAKMFDCNHVTITNRFKEFGWKSRGNLGLRSPIALSKERLLYLYELQKLSTNSIAKIIGCSEGGVERKMGEFDIQRRGTLKRIASKYKNKRDFDGSITEMAYIIGFRLGDLNVKQTNQVIIVRCSTTIQAQVDLIRDLFIKFGGVSVSKATRGTFEINCFLNKSFDFLMKKWRRIPKWISDDKNNLLSFLFGYVDAEGHIDIKRKGMQIATQEKGIIFGLWRSLNKFGIMCNKPLLSRKADHIDMRGFINNKDCWRLSLYKRSEFSKFLKLYMKKVKHDDKRKAAEIISRQLSLKLFN